MMFYVGQNVVCVPYSRAGGSGYGDETLPTVGHVYTVRGLWTHPGGEEGLWVEEITNPVRDYGGAVGLIEPPFPTRCFRPLKDISEDIMNQLRAPLNEVVVDLSSIEEAI